MGPCRLRRRGHEGRTVPLPEAHNCTEQSRPPTATPGALEGKEGDAPALVHGWDGRRKNLLGWRGAVQSRPHPRSVWLCPLLGPCTH